MASVSPNEERALRGLLDALRSPLQLGQSDRARLCAIVEALLPERRDTRLAAELARAYRSTLR